MTARLAPLILAATLPLSALAAKPPEPGPQGPRTPQELLASFARHVEKREIDALVALYEPDAVFVPQPDVVLRGLPAIRQALLQMLALSPTLETQVREVHEVGDMALAIVDWTLRGTGPDGAAVIQVGRSADLLRRQADGTWRVSIDHP